MLKPHIFIWICPKLSHYSQCFCLHFHGIAKNINSQNLYWLLAAWWKTISIHNIFCYILVQEDPVGKVNRLLLTIGFRYRLLVIQHWHVTKSVKWFLICIIHKDQLNHLRHPSNRGLFSLCWKNLEILVLGKVTKVDVFLKGHKIQKNDLNKSKT